MNDRCGVLLGLNKLTSSDNFRFTANINLMIDVSLQLGGHFIIQSEGIDVCHSLHSNFKIVLSHYILLLKRVTGGKERMLAYL